MKNVAVIGLGYVGLPSALVISNSKKYKVIGIDKFNKHGIEKIRKINDGKLTISSEDKSLKKFLVNSLRKKKLICTTDIELLKKTEVVLVSINFDLQNVKKNYDNLSNLISSIFTIIRKKTLIIFESTLVPGTFDKIILPTAEKTLNKRNMNINDFYLGYSYERVTPGKNYLNSIRNGNRVYSGINKISKIKIKSFFKSILTRKAKLLELQHIKECEVSKILENSYRSLNIAFIDEWLKFCESLDINLIKIINYIKLRKTHSNIMMPGLGVGGYCLTKDPNFIIHSSKNLYKNNFKFPLTSLTMKINKKMVNTSYNYIKKKIRIKNFSKILILGAAYKGDVGDDRLSPAYELVDKLKKLNKNIFIHDPLIKKYNYKKYINNLEKFKCIIFCTNHQYYKKISFKNFSNKNVIVDLNNVLSTKQFKQLRFKTNKIFTLGRS